MSEPTTSHVETATIARILQHFLHNDVPSAMRAVQDEVLPHGHCCVKTTVLSWGQTARRASFGLIPVRPLPPVTEPTAGGLVAARVIARSTVDAHQRHGQDAAARIVDGYLAGDPNHHELMQYLGAALGLSGDVLRRGAQRAHKARHN